MNLCKYFGPRHPPCNHLTHFRFLWSLQRRVAESERRARVPGRSARLPPPSARACVLTPRRPAGYFAFRGPCAHHRVPPRQLGSGHNVVHIRVFCGSHIGVRRPAHRLLPLFRQKEILMSRVNITYSNGIPRPHTVHRLYFVSLLGCSASHSPAAFDRRW